MNHRHKPNQAILRKINKAKERALANRRRAILRGDSQKQFLPKWDELPTEAEIQFYLMTEFRNRGFLVRAELHTKCGKCKFDLILFDGKEPVRIIEVKKAGTLSGKYNPVRNPAEVEAKQVDKYAEFGVPVDLIRGMEEAFSFIREYDLRNGFRMPDAKNTSISAPIHKI